MTPPFKIESIFELVSLLHQVWQFETPQKEGATTLVSPTTLERPYPFLVHLVKIIVGLQRPHVYFNELVSQWTTSPYLNTLLIIPPVDSRQIIKSLIGSLENTSSNSFLSYMGFSFRWSKP